jgi:excisionase family DNA binding protein
MVEHELMTPGEVAKMFRVDAKTVTRWASAGKLPSVRTPGGHRRFFASAVRALLAGSRVDTTRGASEAGRG